MERPDVKRVRKAVSSEIRLGRIHSGDGRIARAGCEQVKMRPCQKGTDLRIESKVGRCEFPVVGCRGMLEGTCFATMDLFPRKQRIFETRQLTQ